MKVSVYLKDGSIYTNERYTFSFHGLELVRYIEQFFKEESYLEIKRNFYDNRTFVPFHQIDSIYVDENA